MSVPIGFFLGNTGAVVNVPSRQRTDEKMLKRSGSIYEASKEGHTPSRNLDRSRSPNGRVRGSNAPTYYALSETASTRYPDRALNVHLR